MNELKNNTVLRLDDVSKCYVCGSGVKKDGDSSHIWYIEYKCGCVIWGALDTKTHGDGIEITKNCPNQ